MSPDNNFNSLKVSPVFHWSDEQMEAYLKEHDLPNEWDYFDPAKADEKRECGLPRLGWKGGGDEMSSYHPDHLAYLETEAIQCCARWRRNLSGRRFCFPA